MAHPPAPGALIAILAGGSGRRIGGAKPCIPLAGRPLISYPVASGRQASLETTVIAKPSTPLPALACRVMLEPEQPTHPLCGILTALQHSCGRPVVAIPCDMPFLTAPLLRWLAHIDEPAVVRLEGAVQPLVGRWVPEQLPTIAKALDVRASLRDTVRMVAPRMLDERELERFGDPSTLCLNVNDPTTLARAEAILAGRGWAAGA